MDVSSDPNGRRNRKFPASTRSDASVQSFFGARLHTFVRDLSLSSYEEDRLTNSAENLVYRRFLSFFVVRSSGPGSISARGTWLN